MKILDFFRDILQPGKTYMLNQKLTEDKKRCLDIELFFTFMAINMVAGAIAKCEFKTYLKGKEVKGDEYYLWNYEPNDNQNSCQFIQELITKLLFFNEALVIEASGKLVIADSFIQTPYALYQNTFTNVTCGNFRFDKTFYAADVMYFRLGYQDIRMLLSRLLSGYSDLLDMAVGKYKRSGGRKGVVKINKTKTGDKESENQLDDLFNKKFRSYFEAENGVLTLPNGIDYDEKTGEGSKKTTSEIADIQNITKEAIARVAQALHMPPVLLQGDVADVSGAINNWLTFGIDPLADLLQTEIVRKRYGKADYLKGSYLRIDTTCVKHVDIFDVATSIDKLISDSVYNADEIRTKIGDAPLNTWWSKQYTRTKNLEALPDKETAAPPNLGGETDGI